MEIQSESSSECAFRTSRSTNSRRDRWQEARRIGGARLAARASVQRVAHKHQRSPGLRPGNWNSGRGVLRSLPRCFEKERNSAVILAQTV